MNEPAARPPHQRVAVFTDAGFAQHDTGAHPECAARLTSIETALQADTSLAEHLVWREAEPVEDEAILRCHSKDHLETLRHIDGEDGALDPDTRFCPATVRAARLAAGCVSRAAELCLEGRSGWDRAFCLVRPPGHHATPERAMGFCFLNNVAIAARQLQAVGCERVLIVDWDVHHGNGTQEIFYADSTVFYYSLHAHPHYPGTGLSHETGDEAATGTTLNRPLPHGFPANQFRDLFESDIDRIVDGFAPDFALISCGFDSHRLDPLGGLLLEDEDFRLLTRALCSRMPPGRVLSALEGGYNLDALGSAACAHVRGLAE